ncbi:MAG: hypothetical protein ACTTGX_05400 [Candidatus Cryptobacteroides sp.]
MRRLIFIFSLLFLFLVMERVSRSEPMYRPDTLTFRRAFLFPGMPEDDIYQYTLGYDDLHPELDFMGLSVDNRNREYSLYYDNLYFKGRLGEIHCYVYFNFHNSYFEIILTDITVGWSPGNVVWRLSTHDDRTNRTWFWLLVTNRKVLDAARVEAERIFNELVYSMEDYIHNNPPERKQKKK